MPQNLNEAVAVKVTKQETQAMTTLTIDLKRFCGVDGRFALGSPWIDGKHVCATDGRIAVRRSLVDGETLPAPAAKVPKMDYLFDFNADDFTPLIAENVKTFSEKEKCFECEGTGHEWIECEECDGNCVIECESCGNEEDCEKCNGKGGHHNGSKCQHCSGTGETSMPLEVQIETTHFGGKYIQLILSLPNPKYKIVGDRMKFVFDNGGEGVLMSRKA